MTMEPRTSSPSKRTRPTSGTATALRALTIGILLLGTVLATPAMAVLQISVVDGTIEEQAIQPSAEDPGPIIHSTSDGITFSSGLTDLAAVWHVEITSATNSTGATSGTIQGQEHEFIDWFYGKEGGASRYTSFRVAGEHDAAPSGYSVPLLFTRSSQGTVTVQWYDATTPENGGSETTFYWAYDAGANRYVVGPTKDLSGQTQIAPISTSGLSLTYTKTLETNQYVITTVGGSPDYVPTLMQGKHLDLLSLPVSHTWYVLMDPPPGVHAEAYGFDLLATALDV